MLYLRIVILFFWSLIACSVFADLPTAREPDKRLQSEGKGWRLEKAQIINSKMPRILLIGDSILNGYARQVIKKLNGKAYVDMWVNPYHQSENLNKVLDRVLSQGPYDLIHFNVGLHGWQDGRIKKGTFIPLTRDYVKVIKSRYPKAKLIWANSTPVTEKNNVAALDSEINPKIIEHNRMAKLVMDEMNVPINNFYELLDRNRKLAKGDRFHWTRPAYDLLADMVTKSVLREMNSQNSTIHI